MSDKDVFLSAVFFFENESRLSWKITAQCTISPELIFLIRHPTIHEGLDGV